MNMKISFIGLLLGLSGLFCALPAGATVMGVYPGDLIKLQNDNDPTTHEDEVVYYFDKEWYRHPFPNRKVFLSWYRDFSGVKELTGAEMAEIRLSDSVVYRPGTRLVKIPSVPKVYAVEPRGVLRWIESESVAVDLFGPDWAQRVDDVPESFFFGYREGAPLVTSSWPTGTVVRRGSDSTLFLIDGPYKRHLTPAAAEDYRLDERSVIETSSDLSAYLDGADVFPAEQRYVDTAQVDFIETLPPPQLDIKESLEPIAAGQEQTLFSFRVIAGHSVIIKKLRFTLRGPLWAGGAANLSDLKVVANGTENIFGTKQLESSGAGIETLEWTGAYTMAADSAAIIELRARTAAGLGKGSAFTTTLDTSGIVITDGGSNQPLPGSFPRRGSPTAQAEVGP